jgi:hypothetical protein
MYATTFWIIFPNLEDLDSRLGGYGTCAINGLFFEFIWRIKTGRFKTNLTVNPILQDRKIRRLLHMECNFYRTPYKRRLLGVLAPRSLETAKEVLGRYLQDGVPEELEDAFRNTRKPAVLDYEELEALSGPGPRDCAHGMNILELSMGYVPYLIPIVSYSAMIRTSRNRRKLPE